MDDSVKKQLSKDETGLTTYEYIANNIDSIDEDLPELVTNIINVDLNGQFVVSTARYLYAIDSERYAESIDALVKAAIEKDREHKYLGDLIAGIYGADYKEHAAELSEKDDNFRRIYKRLYPANGL
ncbi:MAG: hypothetical protein ACI4AH_02515 [Muribaculaceae bacterium]